MKINKDILERTSNILTEDIDTENIGTFIEDTLKESLTSKDRLLNSSNMNPEMRKNKMRSIGIKRDLMLDQKMFTKPNTLDEYKDYFLNNLGNKATALEFFKKLYEDSMLKIKELIPDYAEYWPTSQHYSSWIEGSPSGIVDHFTASSTASSVLRWFSSYDQWLIGSKKRASGACTSFLVDITGEIFCLLKFWEGEADWHEPLVNRKFIGIEHVSCGELKEKDGEFYWWPKNWGSKYPFQETLSPLKLTSPWRGATYFQPYTTEQILSNISIKRALIAYYGSQLNVRNFIDHAVLRTDKMDMSPVWPLQQINSIVLNKSMNKKSITLLFESTLQKDISIDHPIKFEYPIPSSKNVQVIREDESILETVTTRLEHYSSYLEPIRWIQRMLFDMKYLGSELAINGVIGSIETVNAIKRVQKESLYPITGIMDENIKERIRLLYQDFCSKKELQRKKDQAPLQK